MATRTYHVDDKELVGSGKEVKAEELGLRFMLDGVEYEIDLSAKNVSMLRTLFAPYIGAGRRKTSGGTGRQAKATAAQPKLSAVREHNQAVREWAEDNGIKVSDRGRIPTSVLERYYDATKEGAPSPAPLDPFKVDTGEGVA